MENTVIPETPAPVALTREAAIAALTALLEAAQEAHRRVTEVVPSPGAATVAIAPRSSSDPLELGGSTGVELSDGSVALTWRSAGLHILASGSDAVRSGLGSRYEVSVDSSPEAATQAASVGAQEGFPFSSLRSQALAIADAMHAALSPFLDADMKIALSPFLSALAPEPESTAPEVVPEAPAPVIEVSDEALSPAV